MSINDNIGKRDVRGTVGAGRALGAVGPIRPLLFIVARIGAGMLPREMEEIIYTHVTRDGSGDTGCWQPARRALTDAVKARRAAIGTSRAWYRRYGGIRAIEAIRAIIALRLIV